MYICEHCGRYLRKKYDKCPGCGSSSFEKVASFTSKVIKEPPKDGYKISFENYKIEKKLNTIPKMFLLIISIFLVIASIGFIASMFFDFFDGSFDFFCVVFVLFAIIFIIAMFADLKDSSKKMKKYHTKEKNISDKMKKIEKLRHHGMLIKNVPYELKLIDKKDYLKRIYYIQVLYEIEKGHTLSLKSEPRYVGALGREDGLVDVLIDPEDYSNYYIDFEIY